MTRGKGLSAGRGELVHLGEIDSCQESPRAVIRARLIAEKQVGEAWLNEACSALEGAAFAGIRVVAVQRASDLLLFAGTADWSEHTVRQVRSGGDPRPVLILSVTSEQGTIARILGAGADDCLVCPFDQGELRARVEAALRRLQPALMRCPDIAADRSTLRIRVCNVDARVSRRQFEIFVCLAERREHWVHSDEIIATASGTHHDPTTSLVRVQVHALRRALGEARDCIRCDGHRSYMLSLAQAERSGWQLRATRPLTSK
jgi:DNA-binding response OmpR family regulator